jgi:hypothetical protein
MRIEESRYSIAEIIDMIRRRDLVANEEYQRAARLWPNSAKSYFIDTILQEFPFPKVYFYEKLDRESHRPRREIVDGQQRLNCIIDFIEDRLILGKNAGVFEGRRFSDLTDEEKLQFLSYTVSVDVIRNAEKSDILQMFRRMNAYTLPLNAAEKRHSEFFGEFKDWVNTLLDRHGSVFVNWNVLSSRQMVRMADAELITEFALALEEGIVSSSPAKLKGIYEKYDASFGRATEFQEKIDGAMDALVGELGGIQQTFMTKSYVFHSLICALIHNRWGLPGVQLGTGIQSTGSFFANPETTVTALKRLAAAHEEKDIALYSEYVNACTEGANRAAQRSVRVKYLCQALQGTLT